MGRTQHQIALAVASELGLSQRTGIAFLQRVLDLVADDLVETGRVELRGLGIFAVEDRQERHTIHPKTGQPITIPACRTLRYRSSVELRRRLNSKAERSVEPPHPSPQMAL